MQDLNDKVNNGGATADGQLGATEWNQLPTEIQNVIEGLGQTLSGADLNQLGKAIAGYVANGTFYTDSGAADAYVLTKIGAKQSPHAYTDGFEINFIAGNPNTGPSTVNVAGLGVKSLKTSAGADPAAGDITGRTRGVYDLANGWFEVEAPLTITTADKILFMSNRKNAVINGDFDIWQRNTTQTSSGYGSDDRWSNYRVGSTIVHSQQTFALGQTDVPDNPKFYSRTVVTSVAGAGNYAAKRQRIENVRNFSGETITLSFYAKADAAKDIAVEFLQHFGTGGSPSADVTAIGAQKVTLSTSWQKFTIIVAIPSISGKTLGTAGDDHLQLQFWFDAGSSFDARTATLGQQSGTFEISHVQVEKGNIATDFERRSFEQEVSLCQRYFEKFNLGNPMSQEASSIIAIPFKVRKRVAPSVSKIFVAGFNDAAFSYGYIDGFRSTKGAGGTEDFSWTADAEIGV